jgi:hypothetical protein
MYAEALRLYNLGENEQAISTLDEICAISPNFADRQSIRAKAAKKIKQRLHPVEKAETVELTEAQEWIGWRVLLIALCWGLLRAFFEGLMRITGWIYFDDPFVLLLVIFMAIGLASAAVVRWVLHLSGHDFTRRATIFLLSGWAAGYSLAVIIGWSIFQNDGNGWKLGYIVTGLVVGLVTGLVLSKTARLRFWNIIIIAGGTALAFLAGDQMVSLSANLFELDFNTLSAIPVFALSQVVSGVLTGWVILVQIPFERNDDKTT